MLQFARYTQGEPELIELINLARAVFKEESHEAMIINASKFIAFAENTKSFILSKDVYRKRVCMIIARLYFYELLSSDQVTEAFAIFFDIVDLNDSFYLEETMSCLGFDFAESLGFKKPFSADSFEFLKSIGPIATDYILYRPAKSGFYSVIENIVNALVLSSALGKTMLLDDSGDWWIYQIPFNSLFGGVFRTLGIASSLKPAELRVTKLEFPLMRHLVSILALHAPDYFKKEKHRAYQPIGYALGLHSSCEDREVVKKPIYYLRGGDKIILEAINIPRSLMLKDMRLGLRNFGSIQLLSDDWAVPDAFCAELGRPVNVVNITEPQFRGYFNRSVNPQLDIDTNSFDDLRAIINNFKLLVNSRLVIGCPSSNLINAVQWFRGKDVETRPALSIPLLRFSVL
jgi:hypothetical protein